jgi:pimeloyl-ACP methyl ester carboxylesterase
MACSPPPLSSMSRFISTHIFHPSRYGRPTGQSLLANFQFPFRRAADRFDKARSASKGRSTAAGRKIAGHHPTTMSSSEGLSSAGDFTRSFGLFAPAIEYMVDAAQRSLLFWDVMRERGNAYREHLSETVPHVLEYEPELVVDGRTLDRPVNYGLVRIVPPQGVEIDPSRRPFVVVDPRAGHGPGIGGFKADSEIGMVLKAGHPCYFVGFLPEPMPGQTIEDIARAEAVFLEKVIALHPNTDGKPCVIGNCQAGWAVMILAALRPELFGPIILAGSPLSYWAGVRGRNPMRYTGGLLGGSWLTALTSDLGHGKFDGAWLVQNFESLNPSNTLWSKQYNLYSKIDTEPSRYLGFERWWSGHVNLNAEEIQFIVDELFIGTDLRRARSRPPTAPRSTYATFARRSSCSVRRATTSRRRSRRSDGSSTSTRMSRISAPTGRQSSIRFTRASVSPI